MLRQLYIKNFALIDELDMEFCSGFSVITGETGAGKSIILGAIGLLLGQRADSKTVKTGADKCVIEAHFDISRYGMDSFFSQNEIEYEPSDTIIRRELTAQGKSRSFVNDTPVPLSILKELGERLVDVHSQHQNLLLGKHDFQLSVLEIIAHDSKELADYQQCFDAYQEQNRQLATMREETERNRQNADFLQFQYEEVSRAKLVEGEQEELEQKSDTMAHSEEIKSALFSAGNALSGESVGVTVQLRKAVSSLRSISSVYPSAAELADRIDSSYIELKDVADDVMARTEDIDYDPFDFDAINRRLDVIYELEKKHHVETVAELLELQEELKTKLEGISNSDETLKDMERQLERLKADCLQRAEVLTKMRQKAAREVDGQMKERLMLLGMPHVRFETSMERGELNRSGQDRVAFLFSANKSTALQPVSQVASGGEIARVMLSLKAMISGAVKLPTIIFDEIDTGVSGKIAEQMAQIMAEMGGNGRQVISITHLPQIAAMGTTHYKVYKEETAQGTTSHMLMLTTEGRVNEIAQMLSGSDVTEAAIANAKQLMKIED